MQCGPRIAPSVHFVKSLVNRLSITESFGVTGIPLAPCWSLLLRYWLLYMSITSRKPPPSVVMSHLVTPFLLGSSRVQKGGLDSVQVHQTVPCIFISLSFLANGLPACASHSHNVVRKPGLGHSGGLRGRKAGGFLTSGLDVVG